LRYCEEVYEALDVGGRWGDHVQLVEVLMEQGWTDIEHEFHRKTTAAKASLRALMDEIPMSERGSVAIARQSALRSLAQQGFRKSSGQVHAGELVECPVCNHPGALCTGPLRLEQELVKTGRLDMPEDLEIVALWIEPEDLQCRVCGVTLSNADELRLADIPPRLEIDANIRMFQSDGRADSEVPDGFIDDGPWTID
jgi:hypothetical protein